MNAARGSHPRLIVLAGATGSGKTALAIELARRLGGELIGADSVQVYRRLDVGSAKPTADELGGLPHHLIDVADLDEPFDAGRYVAAVDGLLPEIYARGRVPIVVGGTGLYLRALLRGLAPGIPSDAAVRASLNERAARPGELARMYDELRAVDPVYAARVHPTDPIRVVRALEVHALSGEPLSAHHARHAAMPDRHEALFLALDVPRDELRRRIGARVDSMVSRGWVDEVRAILGDGYAPTLKPLRSVGYAEVTQHVCEGTPWAQTREAITLATTAFAKRQGTWFRGEPAARWVRPEALQSPAGLATLRAWIEHGVRPDDSAPVA